MASLNRHPASVLGNRLGDLVALAHRRAVFELKVESLLLHVRVLFKFLVDSEPGLVDLVIVEIAQPLPIRAAKAT